MKVLAGAIGDCIHIIGVRNFLQLAAQEGFATVFLGARVSIDEFVSAIKERDPKVVGISYRLSAETCRQLLTEMVERLSKEGLIADRTYLFGGTSATGEAAGEVNLFEEIFDGSQSTAEVRGYLQHLAGGKTAEHASIDYAQGLVERIQQKAPLPLIRHHIGLPSVSATVDSVKQLAASGLLDVISIAPDQTAQETFFRRDEQHGLPSGAGGVPVRQESDLKEIFAATRQGNHPLCRCYSGTNDVLQWADLLRRTINNAWCAVPLSWYSELDRRGPRSLSESIPEAHEMMRWHAVRGIPVEVNEAHQWSLRRTSDAVAVATAYLAAYNAKRMGVSFYVSQYMFNTPAGLSPAKDLAKMLAKIELIEALHDDRFTSFREVRPGLLSFPSDPDAARGQLAFSIVLGLHLRPSILHVVAYTEGRTAAAAAEIIRSVRLANQVVDQFYRGMPIEAVLSDRSIQQHKEWLINQASSVIEAIKELGHHYPDPLAEPENIAKAIELGLLDAPDLQGSQVAPGRLVTAIRDGACVSIDGKTGRLLPEAGRVERILEQEGVR